MDDDSRSYYVNTETGHHSPTRPVITKKLPKGWVKIDNVDIGGGYETFESGGAGVREKEKKKKEKKRELQTENPKRELQRETLQNANEDNPYI